MGRGDVGVAWNQARGRKSGPGVPKCGNRENKRLKIKTFGGETKAELLDLVVSDLIEQHQRLLSSVVHFSSIIHLSFVVHYSIGPRRWRKSFHSSPQVSSIVLSHTPFHNSIMPKDSRRKKTLAPVSTSTERTSRSKALSCQKTPSSQRWHPTAT